MTAASVWNFTYVIDPCEPELLVAAELAPRVELSALNVQSLPSLNTAALDISPVKRGISF